MKERWSIYHGSSRSTEYTVKFHFCQTFELQALSGFKIVEIDEIAAV